MWNNCLTFSLKRTKAWLILILESIKKKLVVIFFAFPFICALNESRRHTKEKYATMTDTNDLATPLSVLCTMARRKTWDCLNGIIYSYPTSIKMTPSNTSANEFAYLTEINVQTFWAINNRFNIIRFSSYSWWSSMVLNQNITLMA